jgi:prepilin peptidase CpaA
MSLSALAAALGAILFPLAMVYAGLMDLFTMKIRNQLVLGLLAAWVVLAPLAGFALSDLGWSVAVAAFVFVVVFAFFAFGWIGGGDAKLAAVTALWFSPEEALQFFVLAALLGGLLTLLVLAFRARLLPATLVRVGWIAQLHDPKAGVPYGAAMAPAALLVFPDTAWITHAVL